MSEPPFNLGFEEGSSIFQSPSQRARVWTEQWVDSHLFCPNCGARSITKYANNRPVADFHCANCREDFELKSQKGKFGPKINDGAFGTMRARLAGNDDPSLIGEIPAAGRIYLVRDGQQAPKDLVLEQWRNTAFLKDQVGLARGWLIEVMKCIDAVGRHEFTLDDVYGQEDRLHRLYPGNSNVRPKIRQQLQVLRDRGYLNFVGRGRYRLRASQ